MPLTVEGFFDELPRRLRPEVAAGIECTLQWHLTDLDPGVWAIEVKNDQACLIPGGVAQPDSSFITTSQIWLEIAEGRQDAMKAFMTGKMKVQGDMTLALKVPALFDTDTPAGSA
jgi:putative sterol carrier protein